MLPGTISTIVAVIVSLITTFNTIKLGEQTASKDFESRVMSTEVSNAFGGHGEKEQKATALLLALQDVADTSREKRTVLLMAARLLTANVSSGQSGGPAARLLNVLLQEDLRDGDAAIKDLVRSQAFLNLVTAEYSNDYYNDDRGNDPISWTTINGDDPISHDAKRELLLRLTDPAYDGWIHVASYSTSDVLESSKPAPVLPSPNPSSAAAATDVSSRSEPQMEKPLAPLNSDVARKIASRLARVNIAPDLLITPATNTLNFQYAVSLPSEVPEGDHKGAVNLFTSGKALPPSTAYPLNLVMLRPRLLRDRPPVQFVNVDGSFRKGSLGNITGAVAAGSCVSVIEPIHSIEVFITTSELAHLPKDKAKDKYAGIVHLWAHVQSSQTCSAKRARG